MRALQCHGQFTSSGGIEGSRNPYWLAAGTYAPARQTIAWSQPEIVLYTTYAVPSPSGAVPVGTKLGYPDLFQDGEDIYVTEYGNFDIVWDHSAKTHLNNFTLRLAPDPAMHTQHDAIIFGSVCVVC